MHPLAKHSLSHTYAHAQMHTLIFVQRLILVCVQKFSNTHKGTLFFAHALSVFLSDTHTLFSPTYTHKCCTTLSVLEFYILMKEEACRPIRALGAGRDHLSADSREVGRLSGPPPPALLPGVPSSAGGLVVQSARLDKNPSSLSTPVLSVLGCSY